MQGVNIRYHKMFACTKCNFLAHKVSLQRDNFAVKKFFSFHVQDFLRFRPGLQRGPTVQRAWLLGDTVWTHSGAAGDVAPGR